MIGFVSSLILFVVMLEDCVDDDKSSSIVALVAVDRGFREIDR